MRLALSLLLISLATGAQGQTAVLQGEWGMIDGPDCLNGEFSTCPAFRFEGNRMLGEESVCDMAYAGPVAGMNAQVYDFACQGEGDAWTFRSVLVVDTLGELSMMTDDATMLYRRTGAPVGGAAGGAPVK